MKKNFMLSVIILCILITGCDSGFSGITGSTTGGGVPTTYEAYETADNNIIGNDTARNMISNETASDQNKEFGEKVTR